MIRSTSKTHRLDLADGHGHDARQTRELRKAAAGIIKAFDYESLKPNVRRDVQARTALIQTARARMAGDAVEIGKHLRHVRAVLGSRLFGVWIAAEFFWSAPVASKLMRIAEVFGEADPKQLAQFDVSALYTLAQRKVPETVRAEARALAAAGGRLSQARAVDLVEQRLEQQLEKSRSGKPAALAPRARSTELANFKSKLRVMLRRWNENERREIAVQAMDALREVLAEFELDDVLPTAGGRQ